MAAQSDPTPTPDTLEDRDLEELARLKEANARVKAQMARGGRHQF